MKILITGASGFLGSKIQEKLKDHELILVSRRKKDDNFTWKELQEFSNNLETPEKLKNIDAVINLAGENIGDRRWSDEQKRKILVSRTETSRILINFFKAQKHSPKNWIQASAIGIYSGIASSQKDPLTEDLLGNQQNFLSEVCQAWEQSFYDPILSSTNVSILRFGVILDEEGGMLKKMLPLVKMGVFGPIGDGKHIMSWISREDASSLVVFCLEKNIDGVFNAVAQPISNKEFSKAFALKYKRPAIISTPKFMLKLAMGEMSIVALESQYVSNHKIQQKGFNFEHPTIDIYFKK